MLTGIVIGFVLGSFYPQPAFVKVIWNKVKALITKWSGAE